MGDSMDDNAEKAVNGVKMIKEDAELVKEVEVFKGQVLGGMDEKIQKIGVAGVKLKDIETAMRKEVSAKADATMDEHAESGSQADTDDILVKRSRGKISWGGCAIQGVLYGAFYSGATGYRLKFKGNIGINT